MRSLSALVATGSLILTVVALPVIGGVLFALFLFFPLFLLALVAVLATLDDHAVRQHDPALSPIAWRDASAAVSDDDRPGSPSHSATLLVDGRMQVRRTASASSSTLTRTAGLAADRASPRAVQE
jgi:hypothetical protein